ncbi:hypothetical protein N9Z85_06730 [Akkermansiaceae bacterium]|nr:hypothetical protein [Akkermansiaceae bacterium]
MTEVKGEEDGDGKPQAIGIPAVVAEGMDKEVGERFKKWAASKSTINNDGRRWTKLELEGGGSSRANIIDEFRHPTWKYDYRVSLDDVGHPEGESQIIAGYFIIFINTREDRWSKAHIWHAKLVLPKQIADFH